MNMNQRLEMDHTIFCCIILVHFLFCFDIVPNVEVPFFYSFYESHIKKKSADNNKKKMHYHFTFISRVFLLEVRVTPDIIVNKLTEVIFLRETLSTLSN